MKKVYIINKKNLHFISLIFLSTAVLHTEANNSAPHHVPSDEEKHEHKRHQEENGEKGPASFRPELAAGTLRQKDARFRSLACHVCSIKGGTLDSFYRMIKMPPKSDTELWHSHHVREEDGDTPGPEGMVGYIPPRFAVFDKKVRGELEIPGMQRRFLAYGPPGGGKRESIRSLGDRVVEIDSSELLGKTDSETMANIKKEFDKAREAKADGQDVVLFITNLHDLRSVAREGERPKEPLGVLAHYIEQAEEGGVFFAGHVNNISQLPPSFLNNFDASAIAYYPEPDDRSRCEAFAHKLLALNFGGFSVKDLREFVEASKGLSFEQIDGVVRDSCVEAEVANDGVITPAMIKGMIVHTQSKNFSCYQESHPLQSATAEQRTALERWMPVVVAGANAVYFLMGIKNGGAPGNNATSTHTDVGSQVLAAVVEGGRSRSGSNVSAGVGGGRSVRSAKTN
ncbi:ATP-binding protein [bacterium]|nr:ATP-binding protein [bacterium]MBT5015366.1 ATP-binding protein [bacterium]